VRFRKTCSNWLLLPRTGGTIPVGISIATPERTSSGCTISDTVANQGALSGLQITTQLAAPAGDLTEAAQTVVLRVVQEALQNVRKHAGATNVVVATMLDGGEWVLEVRDDGRGFDTGAVAARGRRNFGLQFMRERAELVGARFELRSRPDAGTVVRLAIPLTHKEG
jgi:signal transduction histidine kinase